MREVKLSSQLTVLSIGVAAVLWTQAASAATAADIPNTTLQTITVTANSSVHDAVQEDSVYIDDYTPAAQASHLRWSWGRRLAHRSAWFHGTRAG